MEANLRILQLKKGTQLKEAISDYVAELGWKEALITGAIGSVRNVSLNNAASFDIPFTVKTTKFDGPFELLSFFGQVRLNENEEPYVHIHASGSLTNSEVHGGGLNSAEVLGDVRVSILRLN